tara:strand:+ start:520 stop:687 length:168 start_codon:yes stop_codon:yes gene_type:complete
MRDEKIIELEKVVEKISKKLIVMDGIDCGYKYACMDVLSFILNENSDLIDFAEQL